MKITRRSCNMRGVSRQIELTFSTVLHYYTYKIKRVLKLAQAESFALQILARMYINNAGFWNMLWTDEAIFPLDAS